MKNKDFLLIAPPEMAFYDIGPNYASLGVFSILTFLRSNGYEGSFLNANYIPNVRTYQKKYAEKAKKHQSGQSFMFDLNHPRWQAVFNCINQQNPKVLGISCLDFSVPVTKFIAREIKKHTPNMVIVVGGVTPSIYPSIFADCPEIDLCVQGEGEITMFEIIQKWNKPSLLEIPGTYFFINGEIKDNGRRPCIGETIGIDSLPFVDRDFLYVDPDTYQLKQEIQLDGLLTSRGCTHNCKFCCSPKMWERKIYFRSIDLVVNEISNLRKKHGQRFDNFYIHDDNFPSNAKRVEEFANKICALNEKFKFRCFARVRALKDERVVAALIRAGCSEILIGVETGSDYVLDTMGKQLTVSESIEVAEMLNSYEIKWRAFFIMGTPYERIEDAKKTVSLVKNIKAPISRIYFYVPYLGSEFFTKLPEVGIHVDDNDLLRGNQEINEYIGNLIPKSIYDELFLEAEEAAFENIKAWEQLFILSEDQLRQAISVEISIIDFFKDKLETHLIAGKGRNIRWIAALLHSAFPENMFKYFDSEYPDGRSFLFGSFISSEELAIWQNELIYTVGTPSPFNFDLTQSVVNGGGVFPKRRICEILNDFKTSI